MKKKLISKFLSDAIMLSAVNVLMRGIAVSFNAFVNNKIGAESMGLLTLVMSVYGFAVTVALSCVNLAAVKLTSERCAALAGADKDSWRSSMRSVIRSVSTYSLIFGVSSGAVLFFSSGFVATRLLGDVRTVLSLKVLALSLPAISLSSAFSGFFTGLRKARKNAAVSISEQFIKIIITSTALVMIMPGNIEISCLAVVGGSAVAEAWSLIVNIVMYLTDSKRPDNTVPGKKKKFLKTKLSDTSAISLPSAIGAYARQGLTTLEHLAIPKGLKKSGLSNKDALSSYGLLQGIAFPLVMFPYALIGSFTSLLVPEVAEKNELGDREGIRSITRDVYRYSAVFSMCACGIFANFSTELGVMIYSSSEAARYTLLLGLLVPFMYLDTAVDSLLKGLGEQVYIMTVNIADAACGLLFVIFLTPIMGIAGFVLTVWICEVGNLIASIIRLGKVTGMGVIPALKEHMRPALCAAVMSIVTVLLKRLFTPIPAMLLFAAGYVILVMPDKIKFPKKKDKIIAGTN